jgi:hypothetical protein
MDNKEKKWAGLGKCDILHRAEVVETEVAELRRKFSQG